MVREQWYQIYRGWVILIVFLWMILIPSSAAPVRKKTGYIDDKVVSILIIIYPNFIYLFIFLFLISFKFFVLVIVLLIKYF